LLAELWFKLFYIHDTQSTAVLHQLISVKHA